jgi:threonine dehydrogenase-like Zn-dependent dehydrogenase
MTHMLALRGFEGEKVARTAHIDVPVPGDEDVLVQVKSAGLTAGTFILLEVGAMRPLPMTLGHEGAGIVTEVGREVKQFKAGDRVRIHPTLSCGRCKHCLMGLQQYCEGAAMMGFVALGRKPVEEFAANRDGCLAEYIRVPQGQLDPLPDNVSFDAGAKLHYLANALRNLRVAALPPASTLMILGATGAMGTATLKMARYMGVARLILVARSTDRLEAMRALSDLPTDIVALDSLGPDWMKSQALAKKVADLLPEGADAIIDYVPGGGDIWQAMSGLANGGRLVNMGGAAIPFTVPMRVLVAKCWQIIGTRNHSRIDAHEALQLMARGQVQIDDLITHRAPLTEVERAVKIMRSRDEPLWMSVINP